MHSVWVGNNDPSTTGWECTSKNGGGGVLCFYIGKESLHSHIRSFSKKSKRVRQPKLCVFFYLRQKDFLHRSFRVLKWTVHALLSGYFCVMLLFFFSEKWGICHESGCSGKFYGTSFEDCFGILTVFLKIFSNNLGCHVLSEAFNHANFWDHVLLMDKQNIPNASVDISMLGTYQLRWSIFGELSEYLQDPTRCSWQTSHLKI